jgi:transposase
MRPQESSKLLEERGRSVATFLKQKLSPHEIARSIGCEASGRIPRRNALQSRGQETLKAKAAPGQPTRLTSKQKKRLVGLLMQGAMAHG